jgi:hypothetical protein
LSLLATAAKNKVHSFTPGRCSDPITHGDGDSRLGKNGCLSRNKRSRRGRRRCHLHRPSPSAHRNCHTSSASSSPIDWICPGRQATSRRWLAFIIPACDVGMTATGPGRCLAVPPTPSCPTAGLFEAEACLGPMSRRIHAPIKPDKLSGQGIQQHGYCSIVRPPHSPP